MSLYGYWVTCFAQHIFESAHITHGAASGSILMEKLGNPFSNEIMWLRRNVYALLTFGGPSNCAFTGICEFNVIKLSTP